MRIEYLA